MDAMRGPCEQGALPFPLYVDLDAGRLERRAVQRYAENVPLGSPLLRRADDFRKLCPLQSAGRHSCRGILIGGTPITSFRLCIESFDYHR